MPKNKGKGGKNRRRGKNENEQNKRELELKEEGQEYAQVVKILGNGRLKCFCFDGVERLCNIRGKLRKKVWINTHDIILIGIREFQNDKADVIHKFQPDEARRLKQLGEIPENTQLDNLENKEDENITFANDGEEEEDDENAVPPQQRYLELTTSESESESEEEDDDEDDYEGYSGYNKAGTNKNQKRDFDIDNI